MDDELQGTRPQMIILDDLGDFIGLELLIAQFQELGQHVVVYSGHPDQMPPTGRLHDIIDVTRLSFAPEATPSEYRMRELEPLPRPLRAPAKINQAPKQPFRKVMRSVNRNR